MKIRNRKINGGFTLVELIVVLVILAILAALLIPTLLGYIDMANQKKDVNRARACMDAAQAAFVEAYGKGATVVNNNVAGITGSDKLHGSKDVDCVGSDFAKNILNMAGEDPYIFLVATGACTEKGVSKRDMCTVYYACYVQEKDSRPYYFYNGAWTAENGANVNRVIVDNGTNTLNELKIQYYIIANKGKLKLDGREEGTFWGYLRTTLPKKYGDTPRK